MWDNVDNKIIIKVVLYIWEISRVCMILTELKKMIRISGKRRVVTYKGKDTRKEFDESVSLKKINLISNFIGNKTEEAAKILIS